MLITNEFLKPYQPCGTGLKKFNRLFPNGLDSRSVEDIQLAIDNRLDICWAMQKFPEIFDTEEVICEILAKSGFLLKDVKIFITQKMVDIAIDNNIQAFPYVPERFQTEDLVYKALVYYGGFLKDVRIPITQKMVDIAIRNTEKAFPGVPAEFQTEEMVYKALAFEGGYLEHVKIPITQKMVDIAIDNEIHIFPYMPNHFKTEELRRWYNNADY